LGGFLSGFDWRWWDWAFNIDSIALGIKGGGGLHLAFLLAGYNGFDVEDDMLDPQALPLNWLTYSLLER